MAKDDLPHPYRPLAQEALLHSLLTRPDVQQVMATLRERCPLLVGKPLPPEAQALIGQLLAQGVPAEEVAEAAHRPELAPWGWRELEEMARYRLLPRRLRPYLASLHPLAQAAYLAAAYQQACEALRLVMELREHYRHALMGDWAPEALWWSFVAGEPVPPPLALPLSRIPRPEHRGRPPTPERRVKSAFTLLRRAYHARRPRTWRRVAGKLAAWPWLTAKGARYLPRWEQDTMAALRRALGLPPRPRGRPRKD